MAETTIGLYRPGTSILHRLPAGPKLAAMLLGVAGVTMLRGWWPLAVAAIAVAALFAVGRIGVRTAMAQLRPLRYLIPVLAAFQVWLAGWQTALSVCGTIVLAVALAALLTLTTRVTDMLDALATVLRPLRHARVDPDRIALLLATAIRCIPLVAGIVTATSEARRARGVGFSMTAFATPVVIRSLRAADALGEALTARGFDD